MNGKQLKNSILQWAIQGKLVPQEANDEPAIELLKRIRDEKARLVKEGKIKKDKNESVIYRDEDGQYYETIGKVTKCIQDEIPFEVPESWAWCRVRDISKSYIGLTYKPSDVSSDGIIVLRSSNIREGKLILNDIVRVAIEVSSKLYVEKNDILICARNGSKKLVGKSALIEEIREPMTFGAFMAICKTSLYQYVYVYLQSECFFSQLRNVSGTTTINQLTQNNFNNFLVPLPPLAEQKRIVAKIEELMPLVERYTKAQEGLDKLNAGIKGKLRASILQEAIQGHLVPQEANDEPAIELLKRIRDEKAQLVKEGKIKKDKNESVIFRGEDGQYYETIGKVTKCIQDEIPFGIPNGWEWCRMGSIGDWGAGATPAKGESSYYGGDILWLRTGELNNGIVYDTEIKITEKAFRECSLRMNKVGDVLIAMYGATIGKLAIIGKEMTTNQACCACTPFCVYNYYLFFFLMASQMDFVKKGEGGAQPNISREKLIHHLIPLPPLAEQKRIVAKIEELFGVLDRL